MRQKKRTTIKPLRRYFVLLLGLSAVLMPLHSQASIETHTLQNGMDVALLPIQGSGSIKMTLVYDAGFAAHTSSTAGLFKTLEYILFRGPATSPGEPEPAGALAALAPLEIQGGAAPEGFSLSLLLNPSMLREGLDTIAYLFSHLRIQSAMADSLALSNAKESVLGIINHSLSDPFSIYDAAISKKLFSTGPWRFDEAGADYLVRPAATASLENLATAWLVPNNAALVIAGEFDPSLAKQWVDVAFSTWKQSPDPWKSSAYPVLPKPGVSRPVLMVYPDPSMIEGEAIIEMRYRGPDAASPRAPAMELLAAMASKPQSKLVAALTSDLPSWANPREFSIRYRQTRATSWFSASAKISTSPKGNLPETVLSFKETVRGAQMYAMKSNSSYFTPAEYTSGKNELLQAKQSAFADPRLAADFIAKGWLRGRIPYLLAWEDKIKALGTKDITALADEYFMKNLEVIAVRLSIEDFTQREKSFKSYGFETINAKTAFWWR